MTSSMVPRSSPSAAAGLSIPTGPQQLTPLPWSGLNVISVRFSEAVTVRQRDLTITGVNRAEYEFADFQYDVSSRTATWTLSVPIGTDKILLDLSDAVHDGEGNPIDGDWTDRFSAFPSGDGVLESSDDFRFRFDVAIGDGNGDGMISRGDLIDVIHALGRDFSDGHYDPRLDANADGEIDVADLRGVLRRLSSRLPSAEPVVAAAQIARIAVDTVFTRQGDDAAPALHADPLPARHPDISEVATRDPAGRTRTSNRTTARPLLHTDRTAARRSRTLAPKLDAALVDGVLAIEAEPIELTRRWRISRRR